MAKIRIALTLNKQTTYHGLELSDGKPGIIGRESTWLVVASPMASRKHCALAIEQGKLYVIDQQSTSGTYVNSERVEKRELRVGDILQIGEARLCYEGLDAGRAKEESTAQDKIPDL